MSTDDIVTQRPDVVAILRVLIKQARDGNAGLVMISLSTAERIVKLLELANV